MPTQSTSSVRDPVVLESIAWLALGGYAYWQALPFDGPQPFNALGPAFWPKVIISLVIIWASVLLVSRLCWRDTRTEDNPAYLDEVPEDLPPASWSTVAVFSLPLLWTYGMHKAGFLLATLPFLFVFSWLMGVRKLASLVIFSVGFFAALVIIFYKIIFTPLPMGVGALHAINGHIMGWIQ